MKKKLAVAQWVFDIGQIAGFGTETLPFSKYLYIPLRTSEETIGVRYAFAPLSLRLFFYQKKCICWNPALIRSP